MRNLEIRIWDRKNKKMIGSFTFADKIFQKK